jgi:hypothetical protein
MENKISKKEGNIFFIPLFLPLDFKNNLKNYYRFKYLPNEVYAFGRLIEMDSSGGDLVEIFKHTGNLNTDKNTIINSGLLFEPMHISLAFSKNRWRFIFDEINYNKYDDSNYGNITFLLGIPEAPQLWKGGIKKEIKYYDKNKYREWIVYVPTQIETKIKKIMEGNINI